MKQSIALILTLLMLLTIGCSSVTNASSEASSQGDMFDAIAEDRPVQNEVGSGDTSEGSATSAGGNSLSEVKPTIGPSRSIEDKYSHNMVRSGMCGENVTWVISEDGLLIIEGTGPMFDYGNMDRFYSPWDINYLQMNSDELPTVEAVLIRDGVTRIGDMSFNMCYSLKEVVIPDSVTKIGRYAFQSCKNKDFTHIDIPSHVTFIGDGAFYQCEALTDIQLPSGIFSVFQCTFEYCLNLKTICIPKGVTSIDQEAFDRCKSLTSISIPASVTTIGFLAFASCDQLTDVYYEGSIAQWNSISIDAAADGNQSLMNANIHYNEYPGP